jgi:hypothetical protein
MRADGWLAGRCAYLVSTSPTLRVLTVPTLLETINTDRTLLRLHDLTKGTVRELEPDRDQGQYVGIPGVDVTTERAFMLSPNGVRAYGLESGRYLEGEIAINGPIAEDKLVVQPTRGWLFIPVFSRSIWVRDIRAPAWVGRLEIPADIIGIGCYVSRNGRFVATIGFRSPVPIGAPGPPHRSELVIHDLAGLDAYKQAADDSTP